MAESSDLLQCICHDEGVTDDLVRRFTKPNWEKFLQSVGVWSKLVGSRAEIAKDFIAQHGDFANIAIPQGAGNHTRCYKYFTDSTKQERGASAKRKQDAERDAASTSADGMWKLSYRVVWE